MKFDLFETSYINITDSIGNYYNYVNNIDYTFNAIEENYKKIEFVKINLVNKVNILYDIKFNIVEGNFNKLRILISEDYINYQEIYYDIYNENIEFDFNNKFVSLMIVFEDINYPLKINNFKITVSYIEEDIQFDKYISFFKYRLIPERFLEEYPLFDDFLENFLFYLEDSTFERFPIDDDFKIISHLQILNDFDFSFNNSNIKSCMFLWDNCYVKVIANDFYLQYLKDNFSSDPLASLIGDCKYHFDGTISYDLNIPVYKLYNWSSTYNEWNSVTISSDGYYYAPLFQRNVSGFTLSFFFYINDINIEHGLMGNITTQSSSILRFYVEDNKFKISVRDKGNDIIIYEQEFDNNILKENDLNHIIISFVPQFQIYEKSLINCCINNELLDTRYIDYIWCVEDKNLFFQNLVVGFDGINYLNGGMSHFQFFNKYMSKDELWEYSYNILTKFKNEI